MATHHPSGGSGPRLQAGILRVSQFLLACLVFLVVLELGARVIEHWSPPMVVDYGLGFNKESRLFVVDPEDPEYRVTHKAKLQAFREQRFKAKKSLGVLRIVALGGSSVYRLGDEFDRLERELPSKLSEYKKVEIINAGGHSYGSHRLVPLLMELLSYQPDVVLLYSGHNEFEEVEQLELASLDRLAVIEAISRLAIVRLLRDLWVSQRVASLEREHNTKILGNSTPDHARAWQHKFTLAEVNERMEEFGKNLVRISKLCQEKGVVLIMGTVPSDHIKPHLPEAAWRRYKPAWKAFEAKQYAVGYKIGRKVLAETVGRHQSSDVENQVIRKVSDEQSIVLVDVEDAVMNAEPHRVPGETLFADHCHLNAKGNAVLSKEYERAIVRALEHKTP